MSGRPEDPLVLTERTAHLDFLREALGDKIEHCFVVHGRLSKKQRTSTYAKLSNLDSSVSRVLWLLDWRGL